MYNVRPRPFNMPSKVSCRQWIPSGESKVGTSLSAIDWIRHNMLVDYMTCRPQQASVFRDGSIFAASLPIRVVNLKYVHWLSFSEE